MAKKPHFKKTVFDNGLTLLSERLEGFRSLSVGGWVRVGARHEVPRMAGLSHFLEHMLFKGTKKRTALDIAQEVDQVGGEFNAFTARDHTCFHLFILDRDRNLALDILQDIILNSHFNENEFERERRVILQEIAMVEESPEELAHDLFFESIYGTQGLGRPILGTHQSVKKMKRTDLVQFFQSHYRPENLILSVAGDVDHDDLVRKIRQLTREKWPGRIRSASSARPIPLAQASSSVQSGSWWVERPTEQVHLIWGVRGPQYSSQDRFAAFLLNIFLGGGMSSSLFQEIREKRGLAYTVYSNLSPFTDSGVFSIYAATGRHQIDLCIKLIEKCVVELKSKLLSNRELRVIQDNLKGTILLASDCVESRMSSIAKNEMFLGKYVSIEEVCQQVDRVRPADIRRMANTLFSDDRRSILALGPKPTKLKHPFVSVSR